MTDTDQKQQDLEITPHDLTIKQPEPSTRISQLISPRVVSQWHSDRISSRLAIIRWILISIAMIGLLCWQIYRYNSKAWNTETHTTIEINVEEINIPYFYFSRLPLSNLSNITLKNVRLVSGKVNEGKAFDFAMYNTFIYKEDDDIWNVIDISSKVHSGAILGDLLIIPPVGTKISKGQGILITIKSCSVIDVTNIENEQSGIEQGLFWSVGNVDDIIRNEENFEAAIHDNFASNKLQLQYSSVATGTFSWLNVVDSIDKFDSKNQKTDTYYTPQKISEIFDKDYINFTNNSNTPVYCYTNFFYYYLNPTGFGIRTQIITQKDSTLLTTLGNIGGFFGPISAFTSIILTVCIFGLPHVFKGFANDKGLSQKEKKQIALYLLELGVITDNKLIQMTKQYEKLGKQQQDKKS